MILQLRKLFFANSSHIGALGGERPKMVIYAKMVGDGFVGATASGFDEIQKSGLGL